MYIVKFLKGLSILVLKNSFIIPIPYLKAMHL